MPKQRYIIQDETDDPDMALEVVQSVIDGGLVSKAAGIPHYCWHSIFNLPDGKVHVTTRRRKTKDSAHSFVVYRE